MRSSRSPPTLAHHRSPHLSRACATGHRRGVHHACAPYHRPDRAIFKATARERPLTPLLAQQPLAVAPPVRHWHPRRCQLGAARQIARPPARPVVSKHPCPRLFNVFTPCPKSPIADRLSAPVSPRRRARLCFCRAAGARLAHTLVVLVCRPSSSTSPRRSSPSRWRRPILARAAARRAAPPGIYPSR
jgi:hypothetical protein